MQTVVDESGKQYILLKRSGESSRVRDPETGEERYVANARLEPAEGESPLVTAARTVPEPVRCIISAVRDERALGFLLEIDARSPVRVRTLLETDFCESDIHGLLAEFQAAGLVEETDVDDERGYRTTAEARDALGQLRGE